MLWLVLFAGCGGANSAGPSGRGDAGAPSIDASARAVADPTFEEVSAVYGTIETVAGLGNEPGKGVNGWLEQYEGGPATQAELSRPHITLADSTGNLFIADKDAHAVRKVSTSGVVTTVAGTGVAGDDGDAPGVATSMRLSQPNGLWITDNDTLYVLDLGNDKIRKVSADGTMSTLAVVGGSGTGRGLWVANDESEAYVAAGNLLKRWTPATGMEVYAGGFISLGNLAVGDDGVFVTDRLAHSVYRVDGSGQVTKVAGNGTATGGKSGDPALEVGLNEVRGIWLDTHGGMFLATHKGGQIWYVDNAGDAHVFINGDADDSHSGDGQPFQSPVVRVSEPRAVTMDRVGNLIITEHDAGFVRVVRKK